MVINHNITALNTNRVMNLGNTKKSKSMEKLSSGYRINRAADDAAGLAISEKMRRQIRGLSRASLNAQDGVSMVQTAEGALNEIHDMLQRMNELAVQAANDTNTTSDRASIQKELNQIIEEVDRVSTTTTFNEIPLLSSDEKKYEGTIKNIEEKIKGAFGGRTGITDVVRQKDSITINGTGPALEALVNDFKTDSATESVLQEIGELVKAQVPTNTREGFSIDVSIDKDTGRGSMTFNFRDSFTEDIILQVGSEADSNNQILIKKNIIDAGALSIRGIYNKEYNGVDNELYKGIFDEALKNYKVGTISFNGKNASGDLHDENARLSKYSTLPLCGVMCSYSAQNSIEAIKLAQEKVSLERTRLGAYQNRLEHTIKNLDNVVENTTAAESQIRDTDMATETVQFSNHSVLEQVGQSMLAQANQSNQGVLSLLG